MHEYLDVIRNNYFNFKTRARRREYWMFQLFYLLIGLALSWLSGRLFPGIIAGRPKTNLLGWLYGLALFFPNLAVTVRRMHDTDKSGWWILLIMIPLIGQVILVVFFATDSQPGANKWGPSPKETQAPRLPA